MLVMTRKLGSVLQVGDAEVVVTKIGLNSVKLGVRAPKGTKILRREARRNHAAELAEAADRMRYGDDDE